MAEDFLEDAAPAPRGRPQAAQQAPPRTVDRSNYYLNELPELIQFYQGSAGALQPIELQRAAEENWYICPFGPHMMPMYVFLRARPHRSGPDSPWRCNKRTLFIGTGQR